MSRAFIAAAAMVLPVLLTGCAIVQTSVRNPIPGLDTVAIAPFFNLSQDRAVDGREFARAYFSELQKVPGFEVTPVGVTETAMLENGIEMNGPEDAIKLAKLLNVDMVVVGAVTEYDPYNPRVGLKIAWYSPRQWMFRANPPETAADRKLKPRVINGLVRAQSPDPLVDPLAEFEEGHWETLDGQVIDEFMPPVAASPPLIVLEDDWLSGNGEPSKVTVVELEDEPEVVVIVEPQRQASLVPASQPASQPVQQPAAQPGAGPSVPAVFSSTLLQPSSSELMGVITIDAAELEQQPPGARINNPLPLDETSPQFLIEIPPAIVNDEPLSVDFRPGSIITVEGEVDGVAPTVPLPTPTGQITLAEPQPSTSGSAEQKSVPIAMPDVSVFPVPAPVLPGDSMEVARQESTVLASDEPSGPPDPFARLRERLPFRRRAVPDELTTPPTKIPLRIAQSVDETMLKPAREMNGDSTISGGKAPYVDSPETRDGESTKNQSSMPMRDAPLKLPARTPLYGSSTSVNEPFDEPRMPAELRPALEYGDELILGPDEFDPSEPVMAYVRLFDSTDAALVARLADYLELSGETRSGDLEAYMKRSDFFRKFTAHVMISEMLTLHGGEARRRLVLKPRRFR